MKTKTLYLLISFVALTSCEEFFLGEEPKNNPMENFNQFWLDFDMHYAHFELKNIDWDSVYSEYYPKITVNTSSQELLSYFKQIILPLKDAHVNIYTSWEVVNYNYYENSPLNSHVNLNKYINFLPSHENNEIMTYGHIKDYNLGYIMLKTFAGVGENLEHGDTRYFFIDKILEEFDLKDGIIIDIRSNGGGNLSNAEVVASRFADMERLYMKQKFKSGPNRNDFSEWYNHLIKPKGEKQFLKPVVVLTNKQVGSTSEGFVLAMKSLPQVTIVGDTTGGASGNPVFRELPNGWTFRLSTSYSSTSYGVVFEGKGIPPDIPIWISEVDTQNGKDAIIEKAIEILSTK
jgi:hypothetical protein